MRPKSGGRALASYRYRPPNKYDEREAHGLLQIVLCRQMPSWPGSVNNR
jgi:hypothetical protein